MPENKKSMWKRWWFWVIAATVLIAVIYAIPEPSASIEPEKIFSGINSENSNEQAQNIEPTKKEPKKYEVKYDSEDGFDLERVDVLADINQETDDYRNKVKDVFTELSLVHKVTEKEQLIYLYDEYINNDNNHLVALWKATNNSHIDGASSQIIWYPKDWNIYNNNNLEEENWVP